MQLFNNSFKEPAQFTGPNFPQQPQAQGDDKEIDLSTVSGQDTVFAMFAANSQNHRPQMPARR